MIWSDLSSSETCDTKFKLAYLNIYLVNNFVLRVDIYNCLLNASYSFLIHSAFWFDYIVNEKAMKCVIVWCNINVCWRFFLLYECNLSKMMTLHLTADAVAIKTLAPVMKIIATITSISYSIAHPPILSLKRFKFVY